MCSTYSVQDRKKDVGKMVCDLDVWIVHHVVGEEDCESKRISSETQIKAINTPWFDGFLLMQKAARAEQEDRTGELELGVLLRLLLAGEAIVSVEQPWKERPFPPLANLLLKVRRDFDKLLA